MSMRINWRGDAVVETMRQRSAKVLQLVAARIVENVQEQLYPGHGELSGDLKKSYGYSLDAANVDARKLPSAKEIEDSLRVYVGSTWAYAFRIDQGFDSFSGYNQLLLAIDETSGELHWIIKEVKNA